MSVRWVPLVMVTLAALMLTSCSASDDGPAGIPASTQAREADPALAAVYEQRVRWQPCTGRAEVSCGTVWVPVDYADPGGATVNLALIKANSLAEPTLTLVVNAGDGGHVVAGGTEGHAMSGLHDAQFPYLSGEVRDHVEVVSYDPRGIGGSGAIRCGGDPLTAWSGDATPDTSADRATLRQASVAYAARCAAASPDLVPHLGTAENVADLDVVRSALGLNRLTYLGSSYGALLGARYAATYPDRAGRIALDSPGPDTSSSPHEWLGRRAIALEWALDSALSFCFSTSDCPLGKDVTDARERLEGYLAALDRHPIPSSPSHPGLTREQAVWGLDQALGSGDAGYGQLLRALAQAYRGNPLFLAALADGVPGPTHVWRRQPVVGRTGQRAVLCNDARREASTGSTDSGDLAAVDVLADAPVFGSTLIWAARSMCRGWPEPGAPPADPVTDAGADTVAAVAMVVTERDPWTTQRTVPNLLEDVPQAQTLTYDGVDHAAYFWSPCVRAALNAFLTQGTPIQPGCPDRTFGMGSARL